MITTVQEALAIAEAIVAKSHLSGVKVSRESEALCVLADAYHRREVTHKQGEDEDYSKVIDLLTEARDILGESVGELRAENKWLKGKCDVCGYAASGRTGDIEERFTTAGVEAIRRERVRQIDVKGWDEEHDDKYSGGQLTRAAVCYALQNEDKFLPPGQSLFFKLWPFDDDIWKPSPENRRRELEKAGALIAAEWDRLDRIEKAGKEEKS